MKESKVKEFQVRKQLTEMVYIQVINRLNLEFPQLPQAFFDNKVKWCNLLLKTKQMQDLFSEFGNKIALALERELENN